MIYFGEEGILKIIDKNGKKISEINKDTQTSEDVIIEINYEEELNDIKLNLTKPQKVGTLTFYNNKQIKETMLDINQNKIFVNYNIKAVNNEIQENENKEIIIYERIDEGILEIRDSETKAELSLNKYEFTNNIQNDIEFYITLHSNNEKYDLYSNPIIEIQLPSEIEKINLKEANILYSNGLEIENIWITEQNSIMIKLLGTQKEYFTNTIIEGTQIIIKSNIFVKKDISSCDSNINLRYYNENATEIDYEKLGKDKKTYNVKIESVTMVSEPIVTNSQIDSLANKIAVNNGDLAVQIKAFVGTKELENSTEIHEGEIIKYNISIKNVTNNEINQIDLIGNIPEGTTFAEVTYTPNSDDAFEAYKYNLNNTITEVSKNFSLKPGEQQNFYYEVKVNELAGEIQKNITSNIKINVNNNEYGNYILENKIKKAELEAELRSWEVFTEEDMWIYYLKVTNKTDSIIRNVEILVDLQDEQKYDNNYHESKYFKENNNGKIKFLIEEMPVGTEKIQFYIKMHQDDVNIAKSNISTTAVVKGENTDTYYSNENRQIFYANYVEILQTSEKEGKELEIGEVIEYNFTIKYSTGEKINKTVLGLLIKDYLDENLIPVSAEYETFVFNETLNKYVKETRMYDFSVKTTSQIADGADLYARAYIAPDEEIKIKIIAKADEVDENTDISHSIIINYEENKTKTSNIIKNKILAEEIEEPKEDINDPDDEDPDDLDDEDKEEKPGTGEKPSEGGNTPGTGEKPIENNKVYTIGGKAWIDKNKDGIMANTEEKISNLTVKLFNAETSSIVKIDGKQAITETDSSGNYTFNNVPKGNYLVIFEYDKEKYNITAYKVNGISEQSNSDVIQKEITMDGQAKIVAISDILNLESKNITGINIGLYEKGKFDLALEKTISKVSIIYNDSTEENTFNESKLAKVEIPAKKVNGTLLAIEYQIKVTNEGDIEGYANEITDYIPDGLTFISNANSTWFKTNDGKLKNTSLSGIAIKPGESKTLKLSLIKELNGNKVGTILNSAEISKSSNNENLQDIDSIEGNKNKDEDDYSEAELIVSIKTGVVKYTLITIGTIILLIAIGLIIKNKKIAKSLFSILTIFMTVMIILSNSNIVKAAEDVYANNDCKPEEINNVPDHNIKITLTNNSKINEAINKVAEKYKNKGYIIKYTNDASFDSNGKLLNQYVHHNEVDSGKLKAGMFYCTDGMSMCGNAYHYYRLRSVSAKIVSETDAETVGTKAEATADSTIKATFRDFDNDSWLVGPYKFTYTGIVQMDEIVIKTNGSITTYDKNSICDSLGTQKTEINSGEEFYIKVLKDTTKIKKLKIKVKSDTSTKSKYKVKIQENWECYKIEGNCTRGHGDTANQQVMGRFSYVDVENSEGSESSATVTWSTGNDLATIEIIKKDQLKNPVDSAQFSVRSLNGEYLCVNLIDGVRERKSLATPLEYIFTTDSDGEITIDQIPLVGDEETFIITELETPLGIGYQLNPIEEMITVKKGKIVEYKKKNIENADIQIFKLANASSSEMADPNTIPSGGNIVLQDVKFKIKYKSSLTSGKYEYIRIKNLNEFNGAILTINKYEEIEFVEENQATTFVTNYDGKINIENLPTGTYKIIEQENNHYGYTGGKGETYTFKLTNGNRYYVPGGMKIPGIGQNYLKLNNVQQLGNIKITKVDSLDFNKKLEGVEFKVKISFFDENVGMVKDKYIRLKGEVGYINSAGSKATINRYNQVFNGEYSVEYIDNIEQATVFTTDALGNIEINNLEVYKEKDVKYKYSFIEVGLGNNSPYYDIKTEELSINDFVELREENIDIPEDPPVTVYKDIENIQLRADLTGIVWNDKYQGTKIMERDNKYVKEDDNPLSDIKVTLKKDGNEIAVRYTDSEGKYKFEAIGTYEQNWGPEYKIELYEKGSNVTFYDEPDVGKGLAHYTIQFEYNGLEYECVLDNQEKIIIGTPDDEETDSENSRTDKAIEDESRVIFNNKFATISEKESKKIPPEFPEGQTKGQTSTGIELTYNTPEEYTSELDQTTKEIKDEIKVKAQIDKFGAGVGKSVIQERWKPGRTEITNLNLGVYSREKADLAIVTDLDNIQITINEYAHTYNYGKRIEEKYTEHSNDSIDYLLDGFSVGVKNGDNNYRNLSYIRSIQNSYIAYEAKNENKVNVFVTYKMVIKNQTSTLVNEINKIRTYSDEEYSFISSEYKDGSIIQWNENNLINIGNVKVWEADLLGKEIKSGESLELYITYKLSHNGIVKLVGKDNTEYETAVQTTEIAEFTTYRYEDRDGDGRATKEKYGTIDRDSAPGNIQYMKTDTYEDDTDAAPPLKFARGEDKILSGTVFEDKAETTPENEYLGSGKYEDGENAVENVKVNLMSINTNSVATLYWIDADGEVQEKDAEDITTNEGKFKLNGLVPGNYYLKYTYGSYGNDKTVIYDQNGNIVNEKVTTQDYKSTIILDGMARDAMKEEYINDKWDYTNDKEYKNGRWYQNIDQNIDTEKYSSAIDDYKHRKDINEKLNNVNYDTKTKYENEDFDENIYYMTSQTPEMCIAVEDLHGNKTETRKVEENQYDANKDKNSDNNSEKAITNSYNVSFGIVERPKQNVEVKKEIKYIKVTLPNGQVLVEGNPIEETLKYVTYPEKGMLKIEIDNEIIQGATLEITYDIKASAKNTHANYDSAKYYLYGEKDPNKLVKTTIQLVDYMHEELKFVGGDNWNLETKDEVKDDEKIDITTKKKAENRTFVIYTDSDAKIEPSTERGKEGEEFQVRDIKSSKILSTAEDMMYDNIVEIYNFNNPVGRFYEGGTPGNYDFNYDSQDSTTKEPDSNFGTTSSKVERATITIIPPTGQTRIYYAIGLTALTVLLLGVVIIKKKVIDK